MGGGGGTLQSRHTEKTRNITQRHEDATLGCTDDGSYGGRENVGVSTVQRYSRWRAE